MGFLLHVYIESGPRYGDMIKQRSSYTPYHSNIFDSTRRGLLAIVLAAGTLIDIILATSYPLLFSPPVPSLISYSSRCIVQLPAVCHSESCANHVTKLAIIVTLGLWI